MSDFEDFDGVGDDDFQAASDAGEFDDGEEEENEEEVVADAEVEIGSQDSDDEEEEVGCSEQESVAVSSAI
jgi:hypothetical protein